MTGTSAETIYQVARAARFSRRPVLAGAISFLFFVLIVATQRDAHAASINYGNFMGNTVTFVDVTEASNSGDPIPLFGAPTVSADSLDFDPVGFSAHASGAAGVDLTDGNLKFMVVAKPDNFISNMVLSEAGDTTLAGFGTDATFTAVRATGVLNISEVDGVPINVIAESFSMTFTPSGGTYGLLSDGGGGPLFNETWSGGITLDIDSILTANGVPFTKGATKISINLDNTLIALSQAGTSSLIAKKNFGGLSITVNIPGGEIPEPTSLLLLSLVGLGFVASRGTRGRG